MQILPKTPITWVVLIIIIVAYFTSEDHSPFYKNKNVAEQEKLVKTPQNTGSFLEKFTDKIIRKVSENPTGKTVVKALVDKAVKDKYGNSDAVKIQAIERNDVAFLDLFAGKGQKSHCNSLVTVHYNFYIQDTIKLDSTRDRNTPVTFKIGDNSVILGLEKGVVGMQKGGKRKVVVPPGLAYLNNKFSTGTDHDGEIITLDVEIIDVKNGFDQFKKNIFIQQIETGSGKKAFCGDEVTVKYEFMEGKNSLAGGELKFRLGDHVVPFGMEKALLTMKKKSETIVNIPHDMLLIKNASILPNGLVFAENGQIRLKMTLLEVESE